MYVLILRLNSKFTKNKFFALFANHVKLWKDLAFVCTLLLNFFILFSYSGAEQDERMKEPRLFGRYSTRVTMRAFRVVGVLMIIFSSFVVLFFLCKRAPLIIKAAWGGEV